ncbi:LIM domain-containing protein [Ditylenchus destructor]|nr:LIM domain-containing protein [Ditylenchus destructor]
MLPGDNCYASIAQRVGKCAMCKGDIPRGEDMMVERKTIHKTCFKCGYCDCALRLGCCATDHSLVGRYGLMWFCQDHMLLPPGEKAAKLDQKGVKAKK